MGKNKSKKTGLAPKKSDPVKFLRLTYRGVKPGRAKELSGYSKNYATSRIRLTEGYKQALQTIEESRTALQQAPGTTMEDGVDFAQEIRDNPKENTTDRLRANKQVNDTLGYNAPVKVDQTIKSMNINYHNIPTSELMDIVKQL